ncbi:uncharacterized protein [Haliotis cracherodii]|uniref:uncharacterized protein n=1 Tax=Haliotis cracherodii TaxID=6455 RepID=UPI0039E9D406
MAVYTWGFGKAGQLGTGTASTSHTPQLLKCEDVIGQASVSQISSGGLHTCCLTDDGRVMSFGCGKHGRLGSGNDEDQLSPSPVKFPHNTKIVQVSCGSWHGAAVSEDRQLFTWGYPRACGVPGIIPDPRGILTPIPVPSFTPGRLSGVSCGHNYTLAWTDSGQAFSWGCGRHGVLGHGTEEDSPTPREIEVLSDKGVAFMDAGYAHCGAVTKDGAVCMFGKGADGALGLKEKTLGNNLVPTKVNSLKGVDVVEISCSVGEHHGHTLAVTRDGQVYSWGDGYKGKLGTGDQEPRFEPTKIPPSSFQNEAIAHVGSGGIHSSAVSVSGRVFTWGCGSDGRLGHPEGKGHRYLFRSDVPKQVEFFKPNQHAEMVKCSYYHTVALVNEVKR